MNTPITESVRRTLDEMQLSSLEEAYQYCMDRGIDPKALVMDTQPIAFESAADAYTLYCFGDFPRCKNSRRSCKHHR